MEFTRVIFALTTRHPFSEREIRICEWIQDRMTRLDTGKLPGSPVFVSATTTTALAVVLIL